MKIKYELSIGFPNAVKRGELEIDDEELELLGVEARDQLISERVWEDAIQHVSTDWEVIEND